MIFIIVCVVLGLVGLVLLALSPIRALMGGDKNPYEKDSRRATVPPPADFKTRMALLKNPMSHKLGLEEKEWDTVVIGSGIGGLAAAVLLGKTGERVLVLEQHDQAGGCLHTFEEKGFEFDTGVHYIGEMHRGSRDRFLLDQLTDGGVEWAQMDIDHDVPIVDGKRYPFSNFPRTLAQLKESFPNVPEAKFQQFFDDIAKFRDVFGLCFMLKLLPWWSRAILRMFGIMWFLGADKINVTAEQYLNRLFPGSDEEACRVKQVLSYCWGDMGVPPREIPMTLISILINHYKKGGYYPVGGSGQISYHMVSVIKRAGGTVVTNAAVGEIVVEGGVAKGVRLAKSGSLIRAKKVISTAGVLNTYYKLLGRERLPSPLPATLAPSGTAFQLFVGLKGSKKSLGLNSQNLWIYRNQTKSYADPTAAFTKLDPAIFADPSTCQDVDFPVIFFTSPSAKDAAWDVKNDDGDDVSTAEVITFLPYDWFAEWSESTTRRRGPEYEARKNNIAALMWKAVCRELPQLGADGTVLYMEGSTGVTAEHYLGGVRGAVYGLTHDVSRFAHFSDLTPRTNVTGLYLAGQDVATAGMMGAAMGGVMAVSYILRRFLMKDAAVAQKKFDKNNAAAEKDE
eukprot:PhM_4_TR14803/c0_g1_i1/m.13111/K09516/RETSAT; all-trans-retinol 13,14-reductase